MTISPAPTAYRSFLLCCMTVTILLTCLGLSLSSFPSPSPPCCLSRPTSVQHTTHLRAHNILTMCLYWRKIHTCNHVGDRPYIELCRPGIISNTVCPDISNDEEPRKSHFPCYSCIKSEARAELEAKAWANDDALAKEHYAAEQRAKEARVRREAREKAAWEREEEMRTKQAKEEEERKARREGGLWIESGSGKKSKGRKGGGVAGLGNPLSPVPMTPAVVLRENRPMGGEEQSPKKEKSVDLGGRAGTWGPKKILSRKDNDGGFHDANGTLPGSGGAGGGGLKK